MLSSQATWRETWEATNFCLMIGITKAKYMIRSFIVRWPLSPSIAQQFPGLLFESMARSGVFLLPDRGNPFDGLIYNTVDINSFTTLFYYRIRE